MMMLLDAWQTISSFLTPATLFLLLNLVIGTILLSSRYHRSHQPDPSGGTSFAGTYNFPILRTTSPVLDRLKSFTLHRFRSGDIPTDPLSTSPRATELGSNPTIGYSADFNEATTTNSAPPLARTSSILDRLKSINLYRFRSGEIQTEQVNTESIATTSTEPHYERSNSEPSKPVVKKKKMKKTVSVGGTEMEVRQKTKTSFRGRDVVVEEEVDARADNFINNFKEQLKIQRLNSILNYKEMLNRGR